MTRDDTLLQILRWIEKADDSELQAIICELKGRYEELFPTWEVAFLALPKNNPELRKQTLEWALENYH